MTEDILNAKKLLNDNNYIVIRMSPRMIADADECEAMSSSGKDKDCESCSLNSCLMQG